MEAQTSQWWGRAPLIPLEPPLVWCDRVSVWCIGCEWRRPHASRARLRLRALEAARPAPDAPQPGRVRAHLPGPGAVRERRQLDRLGRHGRAALGRADHRAAGHTRTPAQVRRRIAQPVRQPRRAARIGPHSTTPTTSVLARMSAS